MPLSFTILLPRCSCTKERDEEGISGQHDKDHDGDSFFEKATPYDTVKVSRNAADIESTALNGGEWIALGQLRNQMMLISDNGAATAIGETISGNLPASRTS